MIIISIVFQSFFAVAAPSENHQIDIEHIQSEHNHLYDKQLSKISDSNDDHDISDCHHCNHCSGSHLTWLLVKNISNQSASSVLNLTPYQNVLPQEVFETSFRPPIA